MTIKNDIYTCVGVLLLVLAIALYLVWYYYGLWPFVIGGIFVGGFIVWVIYNSRKAKNAKRSGTNPATLSTFQHATVEEREKMLEARGFTKYTDENGNTRWKPSKELSELGKAEKVDIVFKNDSVEMVIEKETPKIRCPYCGTMYDEKLGKCPNCGASRQGNEKIDSSPTS